MVLTELAFDIGIPYVTSRAGTAWVMLYYITQSICATGTNARIFALVVLAREIIWTVLIDDTFGFAPNIRVSEVVWWTFAYCPIVMFNALGVLTAHITRIFFNFCANLSKEILIFRRLLRLFKYARNH